MPIADWSPTAANNGTTLGVNISEGCPPSNVNDAIRKLMADVATGVNFSILGSFLSSTSLATARTALGVNSSSTTVTALDALTPAANKLPYFTGASTAALTDFTSFARTLLDDGDAATARATLGAIRDADTNSLLTIYSDNGVTTTTNPITSNNDGDVSLRRIEARRDKTACGLGAWPPPCASSLQSPLHDAVP